MSEPLGGSQGPEPIMPTSGPAALPLELDALRLAIATYLPEVAGLAEVLAALPRGDWPAVCEAAREARRRGR